MNPDKPDQWSSISEYFEDRIADETKSVAILCIALSSHSGVGNVAKYQAEALEEEGYSVHIYTFNNKIGEIDNVKITELHSPNHFILDRLYRIPCPLDPRKYGVIRGLTDMDVIIAHNYPMTGFAAIAKRIDDEIEFILYNHGEPTKEIIFDYLSENIRQAMYSLALVKLGEVAAKRADQAISISRFAQMRLKSQVDMDSCIIYNKIDSKFNGHVDGSSIRKKYSIPPDDDLLLFVGRIDPSKGLEDLIKAFAKLPQEPKHRHLIIVGKPAHSEYLERLQDKSSDFIIFTGFVEDDELPKYYAACDIYVTASYWEGFNLPMAEAQASGKPVVAYDIGPHSELLDRGSLVEPGNVDELARTIQGQLNSKD